VTLEEALVELGVEAGADPETVRRAYLRVIKVRKPESDPDGFKRAREAYEIARDEGQLAALVQRFTGTGAGAGPGAAAEATGDAKPATAPGGTGSGDDAASRDDIIFQGFMTAWQSIPRSADPRKRLEIAREAVAALPRDRRAYWMVVQSLTRFAPETELAEALRAGYHAGFPEFLEALLVRTPRLVTREEVDAALASATMSLRMAGAAAGAAWDPERTAAFVVEMCAHAQGAASDPEALPIAEMLDVILALQQANAVKPAARAQKAVGDLLRDNGLELALLRGPLGGVWTLAEELATLPPAFPRGLREAFAVATRAGDLKPAFFDTCEIIDRDRDEVERWASKLTGATNIANTMREALRWRAAQRRSEWRFRVSPVAYWVAVPVLLALIRNCGSGPSYVPSTYEPTTYTRPSTTTQLARGVGMSAARSAAQVDMVRNSAAKVCGDDWRSGARLPCDQVQEVLWALAAGDCARATRVLTALKGVPGRPTDDETKLLMHAELARWQMCPPTMPGAGEEGAGLRTQGSGSGAGTDGAGLRGQ
jgi:hypothetical protein